MFFNRVFDFFKLIFICFGVFFGFIFDLLLMNFFVVKNLIKSLKDLNCIGVNDCYEKGVV